jgi:hypothetical protein
MRITSLSAGTLAIAAAGSFFLVACGGGGSVAPAQAGTAGSLTFSNCSPTSGDLSVSLELTGGPHTAGQPRFYVGSATLNGKGREFTLQLTAGGAALKSFQYDWGSPNVAPDGEAFCDENNTTFPNINKCTPVAVLDTAAKKVTFTNAVLNFIPGSTNHCTVNGSLTYRDL